MQTKNIISVAAVVASFAGAALAGTPVKIVAPTPVPAPVATSSPLSGDIYAGYASNYTCRGIVASHALAEGDSVIPAGVNLNYKLCDANSIVASASYTTLTSGHHLMGDRDTSFHNETNFNLGWQNKDGLLKNLSTTLGWNLIHGGLLGNFARYDYNATWMSDEDVYRRNTNSVIQEFYLTLDYGLPENWFAGVTTSYAFQGMTGWWFQPYVGYKAALCPVTDIVVTAGMSATSSYFGAAFEQANGAQAWWVKAELPVKLGAKNLSLVPFVSFNWAGCGALKVNKGLDKGDKPYKNFGVVAGASLVYSF